MEGDPGRVVDGRQQGGERGTRDRPSRWGPGVGMRWGRMSFGEGSVEAADGW